MAGMIHNIEKLSYPQIEALDRKETVMIISVSPLEEHGPHLPIGVDAMDARFFAEYTAKMLVKEFPDYDVLLFPVIPLGTQVYKHIGSFFIKQHTLHDIVYQTGKSFALYGFENIFVVSGHGTPKQIVAIETACKRVSKHTRTRMICLSGGLTVKFLNGEMVEAIANKLNRSYTEQEKHLLKHDYHAGWWETSMMLLTHPELVDDSYKEMIPHLKDPITGKVLTPEIKWLGYFGAPAKASPEFAEASLEAFKDFFLGYVKRSLNGEDVSKEINSPFGKYPHFHPFFNLYIRVGLVSVVIITLFILLILSYLKI